MNGPAHFIDLGGQEWSWQYDRAMETAHVHSDTVLVHRIRVPDWLARHPIKLANVKDLYAYRILHDYGGIYLDFDTISLRPAWDLLTGSVCPAMSFPADDVTHPHYNMFVCLARKGAPILRELELEAMRLLTEGESKWGALGPDLISRFVDSTPEEFSPAPYKALCGWSYHEIGDYYDDPRDPGGDVRVIHLYSSDHDEWLEDFWTPQT